MSFDEQPDPLSYALEAYDELNKICMSVQTDRDRLAAELEAECKQYMKLDAYCNEQISAGMECAAKLTEITKRAERFEKERDKATGYAARLEIEVDAEKAAREKAEVEVLRLMTLIRELKI